VRGNAIRSALKGAFYLSDSRGPGLYPGKRPHYQCKLPETTAVHVAGRLLLICEIPL
jgi:hypothetical protein